MSNLDEAEKKLVFADFLLNREDTDPYNNAAVNHINQAITFVLMEFTDLDEIKAKSPQLLKQTFKKFEEQEAKDFLSFYLKFSEFVAKGTAKKPEINDAIHQTRAFMKWFAERGI